MRLRALVLLLPLTLVACGSANHIHLTATPHSTLFDQPVSIQVQGAKPGSTITLDLQQDGWVGKGIYRVESGGDVRVAHDPSIAGTYRDVSPMGLFWSMKPPPHFGERQPEDGGAATLTAFGHGKQIASTSIVREALSAGVATRNLTVRRYGFFGRYYAPLPGKNRHTPVLLFGGSEGGLSPTVEAGLMASHGYPALAIAYFAEPGLPQYLESIPLEYFEKAIRWLDRQPGVDAARLVVYGVSRGGEAALELGVHYPALVHAVIGISVSSLVLAGLGPRVGPAWTYRGKAIPFTGAGAAIPVERIRGPILVEGGGRDALFESAISATQIADRSRQRHGPPVTALVYPNAGHLGIPVPGLPLLTSFVLPSGKVVHLGGTVAANAAARADVWPKLLRFLGRLQAGK